MAKYRRREAAQYIKDTYGVPCCVEALANLASRGGGPRFTKIGKFPIYDEADLDAWIAQRTSPKVRSTSELRQLASAA